MRSKSDFLIRRQRCLVLICVFGILAVCPVQGQTRLYHFYSAGSASAGVDIPIGLNQSGDLMIPGTSTGGSIFWAAPTPDTSRSFDGTIVGLNNQLANVGWIIDSSGYSNATYTDPSWRTYTIPTLGARWRCVLEFDELLRRRGRVFESVGDSSE